MSTTTPVSAEDCRQRATAHGTVVIADAAPPNSLWVASRLDQLLILDMRIVIVDVIYEELTRDQTNPMSQAVKALVDGHQPPFVIASTEIGEFEREKRRNGQATKSNAVELGVADFMSSDEGLRHYVSSGEPLGSTPACAGVVIEDAGFVFLDPDPDELTRNVMALRQTMQRLATQILVNDLALERHTMGSVSRHKLFSKSPA